LSNTSKGHIPTVKKILEQKNGVKSLEMLFDTTYYWYDLHMLKHDVAIYEAVVNKAGLEKEETLFVDDTPENIAGAKKAGLQAQLVTDRNDILTIFENA